MHHEASKIKLVVITIGAERGRVEPLSKSDLQRFKTTY